ncbi:MAG: glycosyltransferase [Akkermansiaceae bacterium]
MLFSFYQRSANYAPALLGESKEFKAPDITAIVSIRAHEENAWILERLQKLGNYYDPAPLFVIVDFGSNSHFTEKISEICSENGFTYLHVEDQGVFSLSAARNAGFSKSKSDLVYFTDIDFFSEPDHFLRLAEYATRHNFGIVRDIVLNIPAYHLNEDHSREFLKLSGKQHLSYLSQLAVNCAENALGDSCEFVAPYSNNFLCTRTFFNLSGGYDTGFRGHGSEDFELMVRFGLHKKAVKFPKGVMKNMYSPSRKSFFGPRSYAGFRRLAEVDSFRAESSGFKSFHLWHPIRKNCSWRRNNDWRRSKLKNSLSKLLNDSLALLKTDYLDRDKIALCVCTKAEHAEYLLPLRDIGYRIEVVEKFDSKTISVIQERMESGEFEGFFTVKSEANDHQAVHELFKLSGEHCKHRAVIDAGIFPSTLHFAEEFESSTTDFSDFDRARHSISKESLSVASLFIKRMLECDWSAKSLYETKLKKAPEKKPKRAPELTKIFIPLECSEELQNGGHSDSKKGYIDFERSIPAIARENPDCEIFLGSDSKNKPNLGRLPPNIYLCEEQDAQNMIRSCDFLIVYDSPLGFLGLLHRKKLVSVGPANFNLEGLGVRATGLSDAFRIVKEDRSARPDMDLLKRFVSWLIAEKYSFLDEGGMKHVHPKNRIDGSGRRRLTFLNWNGVKMPIGRSSNFSHVDSGSYIDGRLGLNIGKFVVRGHLDYLKSQGRHFLLNMRQKYRDWQGQGKQ